MPRLMRRLAKIAGRPVPGAYFFSITPVAMLMRATKGPYSSLVHSTLRALS